MQSRHGGKREGAGRRPIPEWAPLVKVTVRLPREYVAWIREEGGRQGLSEGLRRLLEQLDQRIGADQGVKG